MRKRLITQQLLSSKEFTSFKETKHLKYINIEGNISVIWVFVCFF